MSGHRWNNRFNPPLETASVRFPRAPVELPQVRADRLTHQPPGAPPLILYNDPTTRIPPLSLSVLSSNVAELTVTLDVSFAYTMKADDHYEFTLTNSNTGVSTTKRFQQEGNTYTIGEFDPGVNYFVYVTPVINGLVTPSSTTQTFLSSPASAPGVLQGVTLTGSGSFAIINFQSVYPTSPFPNQIAVDTNFGDEQVLVDVSTGNRRLVIGPYSNGASYQFTLTPVTKSQDGIFRYGTPVGIPLGNNYFIPGPPGTVNVNSIYASNQTVYITVSFNTAVNPTPDQFRLRSYRSTLTSTITTITGVSGQINDLSALYPAFTVSSGLISGSDYLTLSAGVASSNLVADITDNNGLWYSFRVANISSGNVYTFANSNLSRGLVLNGSSFTVNFNTVNPLSLISSVSLLSSVQSSVTVGGVTTSFNPSGQIFTISPVQKDTFTTFQTESFANNIFSTVSDYATIFAGPPQPPGYGVGPEIGNRTLRWTVERADGPRPVYYVFGGTDISDVVTTQLTATLSGLTNGNRYYLNVYGFANGVAGQQTTTAEAVIPAFVSPTSLTVANISDTAVLFNIGRPLGGAYGYVITASSATRTASGLFLDTGANTIVANFSTGLFADIYQFTVYTRGELASTIPNNLSASAPGSYSLGAPFQPSNVRGVYYGYPAGGLTRVNLTLTASRGLLNGVGPIVVRYNISDNFGNVYTAPSSTNGDLQYIFASLSAYVSYRFTITPFGNNVSGTSVTSSVFDFNPQPPASADLYMTGNTGGVMNISFGGPAFSPGQTLDYYSISAVSPLPLGFAYGIGPNPITRINVLESPLQQPAVGVTYQFKVFTTICGITSATSALTPAVTGGPPVAPTVSYTLGCNTITFSVSVNALNAVKISNYFITEYYQNVSSGLFLPTGTTYTIPVTPSPTPVATYTISGLFTTSYSRLVDAGAWAEALGTTPDFNIPNNVDNNTLALNTFPNIVILTLSQTPSALTFPVTSFRDTGYTLSYGTTLTTKAVSVFNIANPLQFTWRSGTGPFTGGTYRYDFRSLGNEMLTSTTATPVTVNLYVGAPGTPRVTTNNTTVTVTFSAATSASVIPEYYTVTDNYGRSVSGATTLSSYVFTNTTTGSAYSYFVTSYAQGISSAPSQLSSVVYPGRPGPPFFQASFSNLTATLSTGVFLGSIANPYIPITDVCLNIVGQTGYQVQKTNIGTSYTVNGPTFGLTNLVAGESYTFSLSAFANQVYSTLASSCNYYVGSIPPNIPNGARITLNNTTATVSVSAAIPTSKVGGGNPDIYLFIASFLNNTVVSTNAVSYTAGVTTYTTQFNNLVSLTDYRFSGYTLTNGLSYGSAWSDNRIFNAGGPRPFTGPITYRLPAGSPVTADVSLQITISTGASSVTGLWADTSYYINVSSGITPVPGPVTIRTPGGEGSFTTIGAGNVDVIVAGAGGGAGEPLIYQGDIIGFSGGNGGVVRYTFANIPAGTNISYKVGLGGQSGVSSSSAAAEGGGSSYVSIGALQVTAGGGGGGGAPGGLPIGGDGGGPYGGVGGSLSPGEDGSGGPAGIVTAGGGSAGGRPSLLPTVSYGSDGYITISAAGYTFSTMTLSSFTVTVSSGNRYYASVYAVKNQVTGSLFPTAGFVVPPAPPLSPVISLQSTPDINVTSLNTVPANLDWTPALTPDVFYFYSINNGTFINNRDSRKAISNLAYGGTYSLNVYSQINEISSGTVTSASAYVFTNPPTNLGYTRTSNIVTLSWGSAFQPAYPSNITYTLSVTINANVSGVSIRSTGGGPSIVVGSNFMTSSIYSQLNTAVGTLRQPIVVTLSGVSGLTSSYNQSYQVTSAIVESFGSSIIGYQFSGTGPSLLNCSTGTTLAVSITNPSALPTNGYTIRDLVSQTILGTNIYSNSYIFTGILGLSYNLAVQALNSNLYSLAVNASTGVFRLATVATSTLSATYFGRNVSLAWTTPQQYDGITPTTTPPYAWTIFDGSGARVRTSTDSGMTASTQMISLTITQLGGSYTYSITGNYYGISSDSTVANQISLRTTPTSSDTQTVSGSGIRVSWLTAFQSVYLPDAPNVLKTVIPSGGYLLKDLCENYSTTVSVVGTSTETYIPISGAYNYYNFGVTAVHNGISSSTTVPGAIFLGVNPVTNPTVSLNGMVATLIWSAASINGTTVPYVIYDRNGNQIGDPSTQGFRTITCNTPGIYSFTSLIAETIVATAYGAGGAVGAGGAASNTYSVLPGITVVAKVGGTGAGGDSTTVYVPDLVNPQLILDAGGGGGFTVSGEGFFRNGGLPYPDGGPPGQSGYGSGGDAELGKGSAAGVDGRVSMTMTTQTFSISIQAVNTSISFLVQNNKSYNFQIVSYNTTLSATASVPIINTGVSPATNLQTTFTGLNLRNLWDLPTIIPASYLVTNMITGTYNIVAPGTLRSSVFSEPGIINQSYKFALLAISNNNPSSQIYSSPVRVESRAPTNFVGTNNGTTILLSASGVPGTPLETFTLTDGSGNTLVANMRQNLVNATTANVVFPSLFGIAGRIYNYNLLGITNGLSSFPVPLTLELVIPATTRLGTNPSLAIPPIASTFNINCNFTYPNTGSLQIDNNDGLIVTVKGGGGGGGFDSVGGKGGGIRVSFPASAGGTLTYSTGKPGGSSGNIGGAGGLSTVTYRSASIYGGGGGGGGDLVPDGYGEFTGLLGEDAAPPYGGVGSPGVGVDGTSAIVNPGSGVTSVGVTGGLGGTFLGGEPGTIAISSTNTNLFPPGKNILTVYQCVPPADEFRAVSTNLASSFYSNLPEARWLGVAMETDGGTSIAINDASNGSNIYISTNQGVGWGSVYTAAMAGVTARNVTIAANGTWGAVTTTSGLWVSSNVSTFSPWFYVSNTVGSNIYSAGFSPDGSSLVVGQSNGFLYYISNSQLYPGNPSPVFTAGQGFTQNNWISIAWSGDGNMVFAAPGAINGQGVTGKVLYSITGGQFWIPFTGDAYFTSVSPNSNGTYVLVGNAEYPTAFERSPTDYNFTSKFPATPQGLPKLAPSLSYRCACSYAGNIQTALVQGVTTPSAYISYDFGNNWALDGRFIPPFTGSAMSSNGFVQVVVGTNTRIQSVINIPVSTPVVTSIPIGLTTESAFGYVPQGVTGYEVIPYRKNISGQSVFVWTLPQAGPTIFPQTTGPANFTTAPYASGYSATGNYIGYFVISTTPAPGTITPSQIRSAGGSPVLSDPITTNPAVIIYSLTQAGGSLLPGSYTYKFAVQSGQGTLVTITVPLDPPTGLTLTGQTTQVYGSWTAPRGSSPTYKIYSNGTVYCNTTSTNATIPASSDSINFGVEAILNGITSFRITATINRPPAPANLGILGVLSDSIIRLYWGSQQDATYTVQTANSKTGPPVNTLTSGGTNTFIDVGIATPGSDFRVISVVNGLPGPFSSIFIERKQQNISFSGPSTCNITLPSISIITAYSLKGGGGGAGYGIIQGGGGGGEGGSIVFSAGSVVTQAAGTTVTLTAGGSGGGGTGGGASTITLNTTNIAVAGGGGGGGSARSRGAGGIDGYTGGGGSGVGGTAGSFGADGEVGGEFNPAYRTCGGGGGGSATNSDNLVGTITITAGQAGDGSKVNIVQGGSKVYIGGKGGGAGGGAQQTTQGANGNPATQAGCGGGGSVFTYDGGAGAAGSVSFNYVYIVTS